ncbi:cation transport family protein [Ehrlichia chaffeensis str. Liberty]|uniref:TrkH family potassium uptake protein n=1 Tax=Ehrlichia chaffeensis TaxID=945 RepID=UPI000444B05A|nr:TrkH family potassium uptake protein [Ehrlichia chaffeensis]AHX05176.1 cation transport family protein [Ehrlichia chaffeensis str. Jax]AHX06165.1 cation transport family protein [Ehrlichia chaffeensis str. Liberty]AHX07396.1 cation transport family protein [Ehrlichia chaffeensis str. Osceola]AHX08402.1 cation transport family protein [Ehrlichia chaffeensis str. Saint Vincent]
MYKSLRSIIFIIGVFCLIFSLLMFIPVAVDYCTGYIWQNFFCACLFTLFFSLICISIGRLSNLKKTEVFIVTTVVWIVLSVIAAVPFVFEDKIAYIDAFFESVSGLTTTGATILTNLQNQSPGILIWRSLLNAIGGLGIIVSGIFLLPCLKVVSLHELYRSESSDQSRKFKYGIVKSSMYIFAIYCLLIILCSVLYWIAGMSWFDAICHAMSTVSTGGFSNYDDSLQHFNNVYIEVIAIIFMLLSSCPLILYVKVITKQCFYDEQVIFFGIILFLFIIISAINCYFDEITAGYSLPNVLRYSAFSVVSLSTSTGFINYDYSNWHFFSVFGVFIMLIGGCSGSTNSGIKVYRIMLLLKAFNAYISDLLHHSRTSTIRYNRRYVSKNFIGDIGLFFFLYVFVLFIGCILISSSGVNFITAFSTVAAAFSNTGPGMGDIVGPSANYYHMLPLVKVFLSCLMLMGRLEIIPFFACAYLIVNGLFDSKSKC